MIHADQLSKEFGRFQAVKNASFQIEKGEIVGFLGPNGAGKTTTLRMLTGYLPPTSGTATIAGFDIVKNPLEARKHLGYLPEHVPLYDDQRVTEYLKFRARLKGISSKQIWPAVSKVVEQCGLDPVRRKMIRTLSKGYRQRVGLADALLGEPDLLILDEPTNGLDPSGIQQMRNLIKDMPTRCGATVLISSHLLGEMEQMVDQVGIINHGRLLFQGELDDLRKHSQGDISLRVLHPEKAAPILGNSARLERGVFHLPAMDEARLAELIGRLAAAQAGVVELNRATKTLEEIFLSLTGVDVK